MDNLFMGYTNKGKLVVRKHENIIVNFIIRLIPHKHKYQKYTQPIHSKYHRFNLIGCEIECCVKCGKRK